MSVSEFRGPWLDDSWKGWWGDNPPYHAPTLVLTRYEREPLVMEGGTTFYFVTGGIEEALRLAKQTAGDRMSRSEEVFPLCGSICELGS
jgi:dihydrofolate reductase